MPIIVEAHLFEQPGADAGHDAAHHLPFDDERVQQRAAVMYGGVGDEAKRACFGINFNNDKVCARGIGRTLWDKIFGRVQARLDGIAECCAWETPACQFGKLGQSDTALRAAAHLRRAFDKLDILRCRLEQVAGQPCDLLPYFLAGKVDGAARHYRCAARECACAIGNRRCVAFLDMHAL